jgi:hypothetical protein
MDYSIIEDCVLTPGSIDCLRVKWSDYSPSYGDWTPCQCCRWWDDFCDAVEDDYDDWADDRNWPDDNEDVDVVFTDEPFNDLLKSILGEGNHVAVMVDDD